MKKYLYEYIEKIDKILNKKEKINDEIINVHLRKINFFQHERLIHLLVTLFYAFLAIVFIIGSLVHLVFVIIFIMVNIFLIFYIIHYFRLENGVQYLYKQYDKLIKLKDLNN